MPPQSEGAVRFIPDIAGKRAVAAHLGFGSVVKAIVKLREPVWESTAAIRAAKADETLPDASFFHEHRAAFPTWWTMRPLRLPILTGWAGGPKAAALGGLSRMALAARAIDSLAMLLRRRRSTIAGLIEAIHVVDWGADRFSRGAYSYEAVGAGNARAELAKPVAKTLFFAGEATDTDGQASTVAGAIASGRRAATEVLGAGSRKRGR
jgi:monoamine oxidase